MGYTILPPFDVSSGLNSTPVHTTLLPSGNVLCISTTAAVWIYQPNTLGSYLNGTWRRVADKPHIGPFGQVVVANDGKVWCHPTEYGTSGPDLNPNGFCDIFDPVAETWTSHTTPNYLSYHTALCLTDEGKQFGSFRRLNDPNAVDTTGSVASPSWPISEQGLNLFPDGRMFSFGGPSVPGNDKKISIIRPQYAEPYLSNGSFDGGTNDVQTVDLTTQMNTIGASWKAPNDNTFGSATGTITFYEMGATLWMPKIQKAVLVSGHGYIWTYDPVTGIVARAADVPISAPNDINDMVQKTHAMLETIVEGTTGLPRGPGFGSVFGTLSNASSPMSRSIVTAVGGNIFVQTTDNATQRAVKLNRFNPGGTYYDANAQQLWIYNQGQNRAVGFRFTGLAYANAVAGAYTFSGCTPLNSNNNTEQVFAGALVVSGRPYPIAQDQPATLLPNGNLLFSAGIEGIAGNGNFNDTCRWYVWDGVSSTAGVMDPTGSDILFISGSQQQAFPLPTGEIWFSTANDYCKIYTPSTDELIPLSGSVPSIVSFPNVISAGQTVTLTGTNLTGVHEGGFFNDESPVHSNIPIVRFTDALGVVRYGRTKNYTYRGIKPGRVSTCDVVLPVNLSLGYHSMELICNGVASAPMTVTHWTPQAGEGLAMMNPFRY